MVPLMLVNFLTIGLAVAFPLQNTSHPFQVGQKVRTTSGIVAGKAASALTDVSEYLGIPYAKPPTGSLRFAAPERFVSGAQVSATSYVTDCPCIPPLIPQGLANNASYLLFAAISQVGNTFDEDCLTLNIWTKPQARESKKAVLLWIHGGGWQAGTGNDPQLNGQYFAGMQDVVIVAINYRLNIFGYPGLPGMDQNVGLLDQRAAVEWVYENIAQFGGDPDRITIFGQSAGSASVDLYSYAWTQDPLVSSFIEQSGTVTSFLQPALPNNTAAWYAAAEILNCGGLSTPLTTTVACMRTKSFQAILNATASIPTGPNIGVGIFSPTVDNKTVFTDYSQRAASGNYIQKPYLIGNDDYEAGQFKLTTASSGLQISNRGWALFNLAFFSCPTEAAALARTNRVSTYRYRFFNDFSNDRLSLNPNSGAWHGSEIPLIWRTIEDVTKTTSTPAESIDSNYLNAAWAAFAKNPNTALSETPFNWPRYDENANTLIRLDYGNQTSPSFISPSTYDQPCETLMEIIQGFQGPLAELLVANESVLAPLDQYSSLTAMGGGSEVGF